MKLSILISIIALTVFAQAKTGVFKTLDSSSNPKVYVSLGDEIYKNISKIQALKKIEKYAPFHDKIDKYIAKVSKTKQFGYEVESGAKSNLKLDYLYQLREHKKINDYFFRSAKDTFKSSLDTQDNNLFIGIVNSGLINIRDNKNKILNYYNAHSSEIDAKGIIQNLIDEEKNRKRWKPKTKKQLQLEKVKRLRANDKLDQEALEKKLTEELMLKKEKIRKEQERELFH